MVKTTFRRYQTEDDYWRMRSFLRTIFMQTQRIDQCWHLARLEYARWHSCMNCANVGLEDVAWLWEAEGELIALMLPDGGRGEAHFCVHPGWRSPTLDVEMLRVAEEQLSTILPDGTQKLSLWAAASDTSRQALFSSHGYRKTGLPEYQWRRDLTVPVPERPAPAGYCIRALGDGLELLERCYASGLGFHNGDLTIAVENRNDPRWYRNIQTAALYRRDLDLVALAPDGAVAAFSTFWFDDGTRSAYVEPVATVPAHRRRGLAAALLTEGLRRVQRMGATSAFVCGYSVAANQLYQSVIGPEHSVYEVWNKHG